MRLNGTSEGRMIFIELTGRLTCKGFRPFRHVAHIERHIICFRQDVQVDVVELEQVFHSEGSQSGHDSKLYSDTCFFLS